MADDFRQDPARERAVTDSILRPPVQAPFDLLDDGIRAIPELIEQRRRENVEQDFEFQRQLNELTGEQLANLQSDLRARRDAILADIAVLDPRNAEDAAVIAEARQALQRVDQMSQQVVQAQSAQGFRTGEFQQAVGRFGEALPLLSGVQASTGAARTSATQRREDEIAQRDAGIQAMLLNLSADRQLELQQIIMRNQNNQAALDRELSVWLQENAQEWQGSEAELARVFTQLMAREGFAHELEVLASQQEFQRELTRWNQTHEREMVELAQAWQSIENEAGRTFEQNEAAKTRAFNRWLANQDDEFKRWATEHSAELQLLLQSNEFRQQHGILDKQQAFQREMTNIANEHDLLLQSNQFTHEAAQGELDRALTERINDRNITSQEGIEAARLQLARLESDRGYELNQARLALDQLEQDLRIRITDDEQARYAYEGLRDQLAGYAGDANNPEIKSIMDRARGHFGHSSQYYLMLESQAVALGSPAGVDARRAREANIDLVVSQAGLNRVNIALGEQEIEHRDWGHTRARQAAAFSDIEDVRSALADASRTGDTSAVEYYKLLQDNPQLMIDMGLSEGMQNAILSYDIDTLLSEAQANLAAIGGEREWAVRQREMAEDRHAADMDLAEQELLQGKITTVDMQRAQANLMIDSAMSLAGTFPDQASLDTYVATLRSPAQAAHLARLGGETFLAELESAFASQQLTRHYDERQQVARLFLETPLVDGTPAEVAAWESNAAQYLQELYPDMAPDEAQVIAKRLTSEEFDRRLFREFDIEQRLIDLTAASATGPSSAAEYNEIRLAIEGYVSAQDRAIRGRYAQCFSQPEDPVGRTGMGDNTECTVEDEAEIQRLYDGVRRNADRWYFELLGLLPADAATGAPGVDGEPFDLTNLPDNIQAEMDAAFASLVPFAPPEGATESDLIAYADWYVAEQRRWFGALTGGTGYTPRDYVTGEERRLYGANDTSTPKRMDNWFGNAVRGAFGPDPFWQRIGLIREGSFWYEPDLDADVDQQIDGLLGRVDGGGSSSPSEAPRGAAEAPRGAGTPAVGPVSVAPLPAGSGWADSDAGRGVVNALNQFSADGVPFRVTTWPGVPYSGEVAGSANVAEGAPHSGFDLVFGPPSGTDPTSAAWRANDGREVPNFFAAPVTIVHRELNGSLDNSIPNSLGNTIIVEVGGQFFRLSHLFGDDIMNDPMYEPGRVIPPGAPLLRQGSTGSSTGPHIDVQLMTPVRSGDSIRFEAQRAGRNTTAEAVMGAFLGAVGGAGAPVEASASAGVLADSAPGGPTGSAALNRMLDQR